MGASLRCHGGSGTPLRWTIGVAILAPFPALAGCSQVLDPAGPIGGGERTILFDSLGVMLCIVVPVIVATLVSTWWYRASNRRGVYRPDFAFSGRLEIVTWSVPLLTILFLGGLTWVGSHALDPARPINAVSSPSPNGGPSTPVVAALDVQVVSLDWKWLFIYPDQGVASVNRLIIPAGVPVHFHLTSASVMNAFFVPRLGSMIYAMNGMRTQLYLLSDRPGQYMGLSSHYSGDGFSDMHFTVDAVPGAQFSAWTTQVKNHGPVLDKAGYTQLLKQSEKVAPYSYGAVVPGLFDAIVRQMLPPGPGPSTDKTSPSGKPGTSSIPATPAAPPANKA